jgi:hypothetical protein
MTGLEIYLLVAPLFLAAMGWAAYWLVVRLDSRRDDREHHPAE